MLDKDIYASHVYQSLVQHKFPAAKDVIADQGNEYKRQILKV